MRKCLIGIIISLTCMAVFPLAALAAVNLNSYSYFEFTYNRTSQDYVVDLDGDGVNEKLSFSNLGKYYILDLFEFASETPRVSKDRKYRTILVDFDKSDKKKEIMSIVYLDGNDPNYAINLINYRKSGRNQLTQAFTIESWHKWCRVYQKTFLGKMNGFKIPGNGCLIWNTVVYSSKNRKNKLYVELQFKRVNTPNKTQYDPDYGFVLDLTPTYKTTSKQKSIKAVSRLYVYKKASLKKNKLLFTLKKGKKYKPLKIKFGKKVTMIQIKAKGKKGWIFVPTKHMYF